MRDIVLLIALLGVLPLAIRAPQVAVLLWTWIALMSPHREVYSFLSGFEFNFYAVAITAAAWLISRERKFLPYNPVAVLLVLFGLWASVTTYLALEPGYSYIYWDRHTKTLILALAVLLLVTTKVRVHALVWVIAISLGYYAVKGGGYTLVTGGGGRVFGPENSMIEDNNNLGLALVMMFPLLNYLRATSRTRLIALGCAVAMGLTLIAIIGTYSRGALLALAAMALLYVIKSRAGLIQLAVGALLLVTLPNIVPQAWFDRMGTINAYELDASFVGRLQAWETSFNLAKDRPLIGGGYSAIELDFVDAKYQSERGLRLGKAAHSIYFQVLGDHGFVGLALYLGLLVAAWFNTVAVVKLSRDRPELDWAMKLGKMVQVSMVGYVVGGAALSMAYYDGFIVVLALTAALRMVVQQAGQPVSAEQPRLIRQSARRLGAPA